MPAMVLAGPKFPTTTARSASAEKMGELCRPGAPGAAQAADLSPALPLGLDLKRSTLHGEQSGEVLRRGETARTTF